MPTATADKLTMGAPAGCDRARNVGVLIHTLTERTTSNLTVQVQLLREMLVYTRVHAALLGLPLSAGVFFLSTCLARPLRTSWLIVGKASPSNLTACRHFPATRTSSFLPGLSGSAPPLALRFPSSMFNPGTRKPFGLACGLAARRRKQTSLAKRKAKLYHRQNRVSNATHPGVSIHLRYRFPSSQPF